MGRDQLLDAHLEVMENHYKKLLKTRFPDGNCDQDCPKCPCCEGLNNCVLDAIDAVMRMNR